MDLLDDLEAAFDEDGRQPHRRLVHQQQLWVGHQRTTHRDHLLLAARQRPRELPATLVQQREERIHALEVLFASTALAVQVRPHLEVLEHGHRPEEASVLRDDRHSSCNPIARAPLRNLLAGELHAAGTRSDEPEDRLQRRRLPRGVAPQQGHKLAVSYFQVEVFEDVDLAVVRVDPAQAKQSHFFFARRSPRYASTTRGSVATVSNEPSAILTPWSSATTRSEIPSTTCMSCSMTRIVYPPSSRRRSIN